MSKQLIIPQINASLLNNETQQREKQKESNELEYSISQQKIIFQQALQTLQSLVNEWAKKYVLEVLHQRKANVPRISTRKSISKGGKSLGFVIPPDTRYYAEVNLPQYNFGKINAGQMVQLRFDAYPYQEFGYVKERLDILLNLPLTVDFLLTYNL
ncbi:MAG: hypothetical protein IM598_15835 [Chitinophagaceae bacterium]|nr:hypothetical protein [Chitinophagaceae bacterium]MCA6459765.1 hypothetical protein [Chitinophagaceae bacterium]MCA6466298.1 hypothetical protein [Chitinophagaceae bacterium]